MHNLAASPSTGLAVEFAMDALRAEVARKRKEREAQRSLRGEGDAAADAEAKKAKKKYLSRGAMERMQEDGRDGHLRGGEEDARAAGEGDRDAGPCGGTRDGGGARGSGQHEAHRRRDDGGDDGNANDRVGGAVKLSVSEVKRRLRLLKQPATLFGEDDASRGARLKRVERDLVVEETYAVGQQANVMLEIQKEEEAERHRMLRKEAALKESAAERSREAAGEQALVEYSEKDRLEAAFKSAALRIATEQKEKEMDVQDAIVSYIRRMLAEWAQEMDDRPEEVKRSGDGKQAMHQFRATSKSFETLYERVESRTLQDDIKAALWLMVKAMKERNYLYASETYVRLAIGNAPWPIGVTSVGIHERSAREKISFAMNGQAHIMNDEATRKFIHAFKRLMTWVQSAYPTDPSRCLEFGGQRSDLSSLKAAESRGEKLSLAPAPHFLDADGSVKAPAKWENVLKHSGVEVKQNPNSQAPKSNKEAWVTPDT